MDPISWSMCYHLISTVRRTLSTFPIFKNFTVRVDFSLLYFSEGSPRDSSDGRCRHLFPCLQKEKLAVKILFKKSVTHLLCCWSWSEEQIIRGILPTDHGLLAARHSCHCRNFPWEEKIRQYLISTQNTSNTHFLPWEWPGLRCSLCPGACQP